VAAKARSDNGSIADKARKERRERECVDIERILTQNCANFIVSSG
jgi:hypothetical protein